MKDWTVEDVLQNLERKCPRRCARLEAPRYEHRPALGGRIALAVESMRRHMTDEGWQIMAGLRHAGYTLVGHNIESVCVRPHTGSYDVRDLVNVPDVVKWFEPTVVVVQDKREWDGLTSGPGHDPRERFIGTGCLKSREDIFKLTVVKDAHARLEYSRTASDEIGCHAWITYYNPRIISQLAPYLRPEHLIRTWHTVDRDLVPLFDMDRPRSGCLFSGAVSPAYPLRQRVLAHPRFVPGMKILRHPGYHRNGSNTPEFLKLLSNYKVAICTASMYGYALRKLIEATACGCRVITDLPGNEVMPGIDGNFIRVRHDATAREVGAAAARAYDEWDPASQKAFAQTAAFLYDYRTEGLRLNFEIERLRGSYSCTV